MFALPHRVLRFDVFTLDLTRCVVLRGNEELTLRRQSFDVLRYLAEHAGAAVSKEELREAVWPTTNVTLDSVVQCIKDIRQALGGDARWIIRTVSGRGYAFMAEVTATPAPAAPPSSTASPEPSPPAEVSLNIRQSDSAQESRSRPGLALLIQLRRPLVAAGLLIAVLVAGGGFIWQQARPEPPAVLTMMAMPSVAVLPFEALGTDPAEGSAARALFDDVMTELSRSVRGHMITLRSSAAHRGGAADLKAVGRQLDARYLVLGSLRREGDILHINVRLIDAATGRQLSAQPLQYAQWARNYAAARIAGIISARVITVEGQRPLPASPEAAHYTILAAAVVRSERDAAANKEALALLERALDLDPNWVPALLDYALAQIFDVQSGWAPRNERATRLSKADDAVERVFRLTPGNLRPYHFRGLLLRARGDPEGAIAAMEHVLARHPYHANAHGSLGRAKIDAGRAHEAIAHIEEAIRLSPADPNLHLWYSNAGQAAVHVGDYEAAVRWLQKARQASRGIVRAVPWLAVAYAGLGREDEGRALIKEHLRSGHSLTISEWNRRNPLGSGVLAEQRARIVAMLRRLGVPEGKIQTGAVQ
jgi:DNA-binding winged helix-turn-helix (wHTH) protein/TolB-like protein